MRVKSATLRVRVAMRSAQATFGGFGRSGPSPLGHGPCGGDRAVPTPVAPFCAGAAAATAAVDAAAGLSHALVVTADGAAWSWGDGASGQLGHGDADGAWSPRRVDALYAAPLAAAAGLAAVPPQHDDVGAAAVRVVSVAAGGQFSLFVDMILVLRLLTLSLLGYEANVTSVRLQGMRLQRSSCRHPRWSPLR